MRKIITYEWRRADDAELSFEEQDNLNDYTVKEIYNMFGEGHTHGDLVFKFNGITYKGWWEIKDAIE